MRKANPERVKEAEEGLLEPVLELEDYDLWFTFWALWNGEAFNLMAVDAYTRLYEPLTADDIETLRAMYKTAFGVINDIKKADKDT